MKWRYGDSPYRSCYSVKTRLSLNILLETCAPLIWIWSSCATIYVLDKVLYESPEQKHPESLFFDIYLLLWRINYQCNRRQLWVHFLCCMIYLTGCGILDKMLNKFYVFYVKTLEILPLTLGELSGWAAQSSMTYATCYGGLLGGILEL